MAAFTTPVRITDALRRRIRDRLLNQAYLQAEAAQKYVGTDKRPPRGFAPLLAVETDRYCQDVRFVNIDVRTVMRITEDSVKNATNLLEDRVNRNISEGEELTKVDLSIEQADLITGSVEGKDWHIDIQMLWNYRYGENSANGVLTVYPQFRGTRQGLPMAGKAQQSTAKAAKEAAKAERLAATAARRAEQRAKFAKAPERLARECEKSLKVWTGRSDRPDHPTAPEWAFIRDAARSLTADQLDEMFRNGLRTSGDIRSRLEREYKTQKKAVA